MKLLHSKSTAQRILAVSACPCANLFGLVTFSAVTVYRSTTLTTVFTLALTPFHPADNSYCPSSTDTTCLHHQAEYYRCCWSPSGRLFTVALPSGFLLIFDVEGGNLARVFTPSSTRDTAQPPAPPIAVVSSPASLFSPTASSLFPITVPWISSSLPPDCPVLATAWCSVPSSSAQLSAITAEVHSRCLPVRLGVTAALFDEATQGLASNAKGDGNGLAAGWDALLSLEFSSTGIAGRAVLSGKEEAESTAVISLLTVLGRDGVLRYFVGGLYEVYSTSLAMPSSLLSRGLTWKDVTVTDLQWRQCAVGSNSGEVHDARVAALISFGDTAIDPVQPAVEQHYRLYLTVSQPFVTRITSGASGGEEKKMKNVSLQTSQMLWETNVQCRLTALAMPHWLAVCYVREYARIAQETYEKVVQGWYGVLRGRVFTHLGLPSSATLLSTAMVAQLTDPDPIALHKYAKQTLMRAALVEDLEALAKTFRTASHEMTHVCYRCFEVAMAYAVYTRGDFEEDEGTRHQEENEDDQSLYPTPDATAGQTLSLVSQLGALRRQYEAFLRQAASEGECARDLALWVMQQSIHWESGMHFAKGGVNVNDSTAAYREEDRRDASASPPTAAADRARSPSPTLQPPPPLPVLIDEVPVSATRQPALYSFLIEIIEAENAAKSGFISHGKGASQLFEEGGKMGGRDVTRLYEQLTAHAQQRIARFGARLSSEAAASAPLSCSVIKINGTSASDGTWTMEDGRQLLCCVVGDVSRDSNGGSFTDSAADISYQSNSEGDGERGENASSCPSVYHDGGAAASLGQHITAARCITSQSAKLYALRFSTAVDSLLGSLRLSSYALCLTDAVAEDASSEAAQDEQHASDNSKKEVENACELVPWSTADVDVASIAKHLKADFTHDHNGSFCSSWYGFLEEDRHVIVCQPASVLSQGGSLGGGKAAHVNAPFFIMVVQDDGDIVVAEERDTGDDEEESEEKGEEVSRANNNGASAGGSAASRAALCQITGMEGVPLRVSMSCARRFCVIVGVAKYVVMSLYDDDD